MKRSIVDDGFIAVNENGQPEPDRLLQRWPDPKPPAVRPDAESLFEDGYTGAQPVRVIITPTGDLFRKVPLPVAPDKKE